MPVRSLVGLDIGSKFIKGIELQEVGEQVKLSGFTQMEMPAGAPVSEAIKIFLDKASFKTNRVASAVSGRSVIVRYVSMPQMGDEELKNAIRYEAGKYMPFEVDDMILDCQKIDEAPPEGQPAPKEMRVLLVGVKRNVIDEHVAMLESAHLIPAIVDVDSFALGNAFELRSMVKGEILNPKKAVALVDIGASKTNINIMVGPNSLFTREIYLAGNDFTEAVSKKLNMDAAQAELMKRNPKDKSEDVKEAISSVLDDMCHEVHLSFDFFENQFDKEIEQIFVSGGSSKVIGLAETFSKTFMKDPVVWDPCDFLEAASEKVNMVELRSAAPQLAVAVGLAARLTK
jgi:type IV pilus assembly protein PilM